MYVDLGKLWDTREHEIPVTTDSIHTVVIRGHREVNNTIIFRIFSELPDQYFTLAALYFLLRHLHFLLPTRSGSGGGFRRRRAGAADLFTRGCS